MNIYLIMLFILVFNAIYLAVIFSRTKNKATKVSERVIKELDETSDKILIYPEVISFRGPVKNYGKGKNDGIVYLTEKKIVFTHFSKKRRFEINLSNIKRIIEQDTFMDVQRKGKTVLILKLKAGHEVGLFVQDSRLWKRKIKNQKKN